MSSEENKRIVRAIYEGANAGDMTAFLNALSDNVRWTNIGTTKYSGTYEGKETLLAGLMGPLFGELEGGITSAIHNVIAEGDFVAVQLSGQAVTRDGREYNNTYCHVFRFDGGKICEVTEYMDTELVTTTFGS